MFAKECPIEAGPLIASDGVPLQEDDIQKFVASSLAITDLMLTGMPSLITCVYHRAHCTPRSM